MQNKLIQNAEFRIQNWGYIDSNRYQYVALFLTPTPREPILLSFKSSKSCSRPECRIEVELKPIDCSM
jgi:hypothetical protein